MTAVILLCGHGTRDPRGVAQFEALVAALRSRHPDRRIAHGFLEFASPGLDETVARLFAEGRRAILAIPVLLFAAGHLKRDLPDLFAGLQRRHHGLRVRLGEPLGLTPGVLESACRLAERAAANLPAKAADTCLLVIGRGTSDPAANAEAVRLAPMLCERLGWGFATTGFIALTQPTITEAMQLVERLSFGRVVVLPLVLFDGFLHRGIARDLAAWGTRSPQRWLLADPFCADDAWLSTFDARMESGQGGQAPLRGPGAAPLALLASPDLPPYAGSVPC